MSRLQHFSIAYTDVWGFHISFFPLQNGQKNKYPSICPRILLICFNESCRVCSFKECATVNVLKFQTFSLCVFKWNDGFQGVDSQSACQNSKEGRPWSDCYFRSSLIWVWAVCLGFFSGIYCSNFRLDCKCAVLKRSNFKKIRLQAKL